MNNIIAYNIPASELIHAVTTMLNRGNRYIDVLVDKDNILRLRSSRKRADKKEETPPLPEGIDLMDLT